MTYLPNNFLNVIYLKISKFKRSLSLQSPLKRIYYKTRDPVSMLYNAARQKEISSQSIPLFYKSHLQTEPVVLQRLIFGSKLSQIIE